MAAFRMDETWVSNPRRTFIYKNKSIFEYETMEESDNNSSNHSMKQFSDVYNSDVCEIFKNMQNNIMSRHTPILKKLLSETTFDSGYESHAEKYFNNLYNRYGVIADTILLNIYLEYWYEDTHLLKHILFIVANLPKARRKTLELIPLSGINNPDIEIKDLSVRCFEAWEQRRHLPVLRKLRKTIEEDWFKEYLDDVINTLEER